jgi:putative ABC transport system permease protein
MQSVSVDGHVVSSGEHVGSRLVASNYFDVMGVPLLRGRMFDDRDLPGSERVVVINERMARRFPAGRDPIGQRITWDEAPNDSSMWFRIVGVVGDEHQNGVHVPPPMETFTPFRQLPGVRVRLIVHTRTSIATLAPELRAQLAAVDPLLALDGLRSLDDMYASQFGRDRLLLALIGGFAVLALVLASVGVYGLMAEMVARRTFEIGIRVALGAASHDIAGIVIRQGFALTAIGAAIGLLAALAGTRLLAGVLFGVAPTDAVTFTGVIAILLLVALIACAVPAHRAARLEPTEALRHG